MKVMRIYILYMYVFFSLAFVGFKRDCNIDIMHSTGVIDSGVSGSMNYLISSHCFVSENAPVKHQLNRQYLRPADNSRGFFATSALHTQEVAYCLKSFQEDTVSRQN